jgi:membrane-bound lytic murein transglycosylase B
MRGRIAGTENWRGFAREGPEAAMVAACGFVRRATVIAVASLLAVAAPAGAASDGFRQWVDDLRSEALAAGIAASTFDRAFLGVEPLPRVIELDRKQPEFTETFWQYLDKRVTAERVARGQAMLAQHRPLLERVYRRYGVQPQYLVAFWGLETNYGGFTGSYPLVGALATLAFDGRRGPFFRQQLLATLGLIQQGDIPPDARSSWAGAVGQPQFMPTTYRDFAVDFDGDGRRDLWNSLADVFASAAHYMSTSGWQEDRIWGRQVRLPAGFDYALTGIERERPIGEWQRLGVRRADGLDLPSVAIDGAIILPGGVGGGPALLVYRNFQTVMVWNRSVLYAVAVGHLADRVVGMPPLGGPRPVRDEALSRNDVSEIQRLLTKVGIEAGEVDGVVGSRTREAIRAFQVRMVLPADGYPTVALLERLRSAAGE